MPYQGILSMAQTRIILVRAHYRFVISTRWHRCKRPQDLLACTCLGHKWITRVHSKNYCPMPAFPPDAPPGFPCMENQGACQSVSTLYPTTWPWFTQCGAAWDPQAHSLPWFQTQHQIGTWVNHPRTLWPILTTDPATPPGCLLYKKIPGTLWPITIPNSAPATFSGFPLHREGGTHQYKHGLASAVLP